MIRLLSKGDLDDKSKKTVAFIKSLFGETHAESRDLIHKLTLDISKHEASVSEEYLINLAKKPKQTTLYDKVCYLPDDTILMESKISPLLVKPK